MATALADEREPVILKHAPHIAAGQDLQPTQRPPRHR
jgi:hypothetical protein